MSTDNTTEARNNPTSSATMQMGGEDRGGTSRYQQERPDVCGDLDRTDPPEVPVMTSDTGPDRKYLFAVTMQHSRLSHDRYTFKVVAYSYDEAVRKSKVALVDGIGLDQIFARKYYADQVLMEASSESEKGPMLLV